MSEYEHRQPKGISQRVPEEAALMCLDCGAVVADTDLHSTWHEANKEAKPKEARDG